MGESVKPVIEHFWNKGHLLILVPAASLKTSTKNVYVQVYMKWEKPGERGLLFLSRPKGQ